MNWRAILIRLAWLAALAIVCETGTIWVCSSWFWTPIQRHYLPTYIWCSLPVITPATAEARIIWKTAPHRKREPATDDDAVDSEGGTGMQLSQSALDAGWKGLAEGSLQQYLAATLRRDLPDLAFDGEGPWSFLLLPEACGLVMFCYGFYGCVRLGNWLMGWAADLTWKHQRSPWEELLPSLFDRFSATARGIQSQLAKLHRSATQCIKTHRAAPTASVAQPEPPARPASFAFPLFGVYNGTGEGYLWSERDEIE